MPAPANVLDLIERFRRNVSAYKSPQYNETQLRREFVDPLFDALGWDVGNRSGYAEAYKDVVHEDSLRVEGVPRSPDYSFRIGGVRKFFVETKKPSVNLRDDPAPAYQLKRYAWSAKLPIGILTDFEEFVVYDTRAKPSLLDRASKGRLIYLTYDRYEPEWDALAALFSPEAIRRGDLDKWAQPNTRRRGTATVDDAFLEEIESWRASLARNIALRNHDITVAELNTAVQATIDRIVFLRIAEDRGLEDHGQLRGLLTGAGVYGRLMTVFRQADARYNSGLFHFVEERGRSSEVDRLSAALQIDDRTLRDIIGGLYYPESPYEFSVLPADILGQVYERFLGKVIRLTDAHRAVVELKPEVRRAGGVYYTPTHIVEHIVRASLAPMLAEKVPTPARPTSAQSADIKVLDPACGSGSFLLGAYQYLLNWHRDWYTRDGGEKWAKRRNPTVFLWNTGEWRLTTAERKRILISCIFGVDIDAQAVEVTKLSLLLKVLEGETQQAIQTNLRLFHERALPDLDSNIKRGNSLIENDFYVSAQGNLLDDSDMVHAFDWRSEFRATMRAGGFHAVIGNPPYDVLEKERGAASWPHAALAEYVGTIDKYSPALGGKLNLFRFFLIRGLSLTRPTGRFGMIVPLALLADISCARARQHLMLSTNGLVANCFPQKDNANRRIFRDAKLSTVVLTGERIDVQRQDASVNVRVFPWNSFSDQPRESQVRLVDTEVIDPINTPVPLVSADEWELLRMLYSRRGVTRLGEVKDFSITRGEINQTVYRAYITSNPEHARLLKGVEIARYALRERLSQGAREWFDERRYLRDYKPKAIVQAQRIATQRITGVDEQLRIVATLIDAPTYFADSTNSVPHFSLPARVPARSTEFEALSVAVQAYEHKQQRWYE